MQDAYSPNFPLDGLGLDRRVGRYDLCPRSARATRALLSLSAQKRASSFFAARLGIWLTPSGAARPPRASADRALLDFLDTQVTLIGGLDSLIHNDHWRCVAPPRPRPSR